MTALLHPIREELRSLDLDRALAALAGPQHGVASRRQLLELGFGRGAVDRRVARGQLHRVHQGVYAVGHARLTRQGRHMAAVLAVRDGALSHMAGAVHWQLCRPRGGVIVTTPRKLKPRPGIVVHCLPLPPDEVTVRDGIPVTTVPRTIFDLGVLGRRPVERALHEAEYRRYSDNLSVADVLARYPQRKGAGVIRAVLADSRAGIGMTDSDLEELFLAFLGARGLPLPRTNVWLPVGGRWIRADFVFDRERLIVELDGETHATAYGRRRDHRRDAAAQADGWRVMRTTKYALLIEPDGAEADLRRLLAL